MRQSVYVIQPTYRTMDGKPITRVPVFNYSCNLPILSATIPTDQEKRFCLEYCEPIDYESDASVVLVTSAGYDIAHALDIVGRFKGRGKIVIAGANMDSLSDRLLGECCNALFLGYPDPQMMRRMLDDAAAGILQRTYVPDSLNMDYPLDYDVLRGKPLPFLPMLASLGCRNTCSYCCYSPLYRGRYYLRPMERVLRDLESVASFDKPIAFLDANLYNNREYLLRLCRNIAALDIRCAWGGQCTVDIGDDPEVLEAMRNAGCRLIIFGLESLRQENLTQLNKPVRAKDYGRQLQNVRKAGIHCAAYFMVGMDGDNVETFQEIEQFIINAPIAVPYLHLLVPVPGTALFDNLRSDGRLAVEAFDEYALLDPHYSVPCSSAFFRPKGLTAQELEDGYFLLAKRLSTMLRIFRRSLIPDVRIASAIWTMNMETRKYVRGMAARRRISKQAVSGGLSASAS